MRKLMALLISAAMLTGLSAGAVTAQTDGSCVDVAGNGLQLCGAFRDYWEANDGAASFGAPLSDEFEEMQFDTGASYAVQYFEHQRFELHPNNAGSLYGVLLGRLGAEVLATTGRSWAAFPKDDPGTPNYHDVTGFAVAPEFIDYWSGHGLDFGDSGVSYRESLALFGHPISPARTQTDADGNPVLMQWFERARFEFHDGAVSTGALGAELLAVPGVTDPVTASMLAQVQRSVAHFSDLDVAQTGGWNLVDGLDHCFTNPGVGDMGVHYINTDLLDTTTSALQPEAMVYQHGPDGELSLGAVEWIVPAEAWDAEVQNRLPEVLGHSFHLNEALGVYVLHAWLFLENPSGVFEDWNPDVSCPSDDSEDGEADQLDPLREAVAPYQDVNAAIADGYALLDGLDHCFDSPGVGAMGVHYINADLLDLTLDPLQPESMVYQHGPDGALSLGAVEWIVPAEPWDAEHPDELPMVMDRHLHLNEALGVYVMHAWLFLENPAGTFEDWNPDVSCPE